MATFYCVGWGRALGERLGYMGSEIFAFQVLVAAERHGGVRGERANYAFDHHRFAQARDAFATPPTIF
jgi:hypothetical protein